MFEVKQWPFCGASVGLAEFGESMAVQSELESTKISTILRHFAVTGVLPQTGRVALPADVFLGGDDFQSLSEKLSDARSSGLTEEMLKEDEHESGNANPDDSQHGFESGVAAPADESGQQQQ